MLKSLQNYITWIAAIICFMAAFYIALEHTAHFFALHNYFFSPFADDILDNAHFTYRIALKKEGYIHLFDPFVDHRVAFERVQELIDFLWTNGIQTLQPYRIALLLWLNFLLVNYFIIYLNPNLTTPIKILLSGVYLALLFAGMSINNYVSTMQFTWPVIFLFSLLAFICVAAFCTLPQKNTTLKKYLYILLVTLNVNIVLYTFNIGVILWPIIFIILIKHKKIHTNLLFWLLSASLTYYFYIAPYWVMANWNSYTAHSNLSSSLHRPEEIFFYIARILSVPFIAKAFTHYYLSSLIIGTSCLALTLVTYWNFFRKKTWSFTDTVFFGYFNLALMTLLIIAAVRPISGKFSPIEWRFLTVALLFLFCLLLSLFNFPSSFPEKRQKMHTAFVIAISLWTVTLFLPLDANLSGGTYELGFFNQVFISEAVGIPINDQFLQASKIYQTNGTLNNHIELNQMQKDHQKGPYSFWAAQHFEQSLNDISQKSSLSFPAEITIVYDYRAHASPGLLLNVRLNHQFTPLNANYSVIFTNSANKIIGFAISAPILRPLWSLFYRQPTLLWRGAINTNLLTNNRNVYVWAILPQEKISYPLGRLIVPSPLTGQKEPTWAWQHTNHFGM